MNKPTKLVYGTETIKSFYLFIIFLYDFLELAIAYENAL